MDCNEIVVDCGNLRVISIKILTQLRYQEVRGKTNLCYSIFSFLLEVKNMSCFLCTTSPDPGPSTRGSAQLSGAEEISGSMALKCSTGTAAPCSKAGGDSAAFPFFPV